MLDNDEMDTDLVRRYEEMLHSGELRYFDAEDLEDIAYEYELSEQYLSALGAIEYGLQLHPGNPELLVRRAGYLLCLDRIEDAEAQINAVHSFSVNACLIRAEIALIRENVPQAIACIESLFDSDELSLDLCLDVVDLYLDYDCFDEMVAFVKKACTFLSKDTEALIRELARAYEEHQDNEAAIALYNQLLDSNPYSHADWFDLARLLALQERYDEAIEACDFALAIDENNVETMISKGCCLYDKGEYQAAMNLFDEVLAIAGEKSLAHAMLGACYSHMGLYEKAIQSLRLAIKYADYPNADYYYQLATNYYSLGDIPNTRKALEEVLEVDASHVDAIMFVGELDMADNEWEKAESRFLRVKELDPENAYVYKNLAQLMENKAIATSGDERVNYRGQAIAYYTEAVELTSHADVEMLLGLALAHFKYGDVNEAMLLAETIESLMKDPEVVKKMDWENRQRIESLGRIMELLRGELGKNLNTEF